MALTEADFWIVEDTRISSKLGHVLEVKKSMRVANDHTDDYKLNQILNEIEEGRTAALLTDGGAPGVSDPGSRLADLAHDRGIEVDAIPGPSAPITAIMLSGFYAQRFAFLGFLGRTKGAMRKELTQFVESPYTLVLFESPHRFRTLLETSAEVLGFRRYAVCREISKLNQQVFRGTLPTIPTEGEVPGKGEITIVIEGYRRTQQEAEHAKLENE